MTKLDESTIKIGSVDITTSVSTRSMPCTYITISWSANIGFGIYTLAVQDGSIKAYSETMDCNEDKSFLKALLNKLVDNVDVVE